MHILVLLQNLNFSFEVTFSRLYYRYLNYFYRDVSTIHFLEVSPTRALTSVGASIISVIREITMARGETTTAGFGQLAKSSLASES